MKKLLYILIFIIIGLLVGFLIFHKSPGQSNTSYSSQKVPIFSDMYEFGITASGTWKNIQGSSDSMMSSIRIAKPCLQSSLKDRMRENSRLSASISSDRGKQQTDAKVVERYGCGSNATKGLRKQW